MRREVLITNENEAPILYMSARDTNIAPGARYGPVVLDLYIVECCTEGSGSVIINDIEMPFKAGDCYVLQPGQKVIFTASSVTSRRGVWCALDGLAVSRTVSALGVSAKEPFVSHTVFDAAVAAINGMIDAKSEPDMGAELRRRGYVYMLLGALASTEPIKDKNTWVDKAIGYIETNYYKNISVTDMAREVGLERCYFTTLFRSCTGVTPHAYLSQVRVRKASALISDKSYSVSEAAAMVGLDPQNLARMFKKVTGKLPKDFKK